MSVPNQNVIKITSRDFKDGKLFARYHIEAMQLAMKELTDAGLKLWLYIASNQDNFNLEIGQKEACAWTGMGRSSYFRAFDVLVEKRYLVPVREGSNIYMFYEFPQQSQIGTDDSTESQIGTSSGDEYQIGTDIPLQSQIGTDSSVEYQNDTDSGIQSQIGTSSDSQSQIGTIGGNKIEYNGFVF